MDQTLYARSNLDECTVIGHNDNLALDNVANLEVGIQRIPWVRSELLETKSDTLLLIIKVKNNNVDLLVKLNDLLRIAYAAPAEVCDMDKTVNTAQVDA